jgi:indolepyruvate ferredoxin oxidoreductase
VSVEPLNTEFGRKRKINQSTCNQDYSCLDGFCPSFVTLEGAENPHGVRLPALTADSTPLPTFEASPGVRNIVFTGVGGTGVTTTASILAMAAHVDGKAASVVDMTGLAQKGGAVFSHVRIGENEASIVGGRTPAASAHVLIACDVMVAAGADALALYAKDRTVAFGNADLSPTADFVTDRDVRFDSGGMARRIAAAARSYDETPAHHMAETELGDAIYANMIMLGFAWQKGVIPISSRALYRAIRLNGVAADQNLQAFEMGRRAAHDPESRGRREADVATPETLPLAELIAHRTRELAAYQNDAYARRYQDRVEAIAHLEGPLGSEALTRAVAINLYKLMAYKDEYEVARLYADGRFDAYRSQSFRGGKAKVWLAPPILGAKDDQGHPRKIAFGGWMLDYGFPVLARLKGLRGTGLDLFGYSLERQMERALIVTYEADLQRIARELTPERLALAVEIAQVPQDIRGFGHVKQASLGPAMGKRETLWAQWDDAGASDAV